jgi:POT family proton-dependent oligopeptide transporter
VLAIRQPNKQQTQKMMAFVMLMIASLVFWSLYQIAPMGLTLFIKHNVDTHLFGIVLSPQWIQNVNTVVIVLGGPIIGMVYTKLRAKGVDINIPLQFACALFLIGAAFLILPSGIAGADLQGLTHVNWVLACYLLQSLGELLISPVGYAMIGQLAPSNLQGMMMGAWMMMTGVAATASNHFSNMMIGETLSNDPLVTNGGFSNVFALLGWVALAAGIGLLLLTPMLKRLMSDKEGDGDSELEQEQRAFKAVLS